MGDEKRKLWRENHPPSVNGEKDELGDQTNGRATKTCCYRWPSCSAETGLRTRVLALLRQEVAIWRCFNRQEPMDVLGIDAPPTLLLTIDAGGYSSGRVIMGALNELTALGSMVKHEGRPALMEILKRYTRLGRGRLPLFKRNSVAERMNKTLLDKARSMLYHAHMPLSFWAEAVDYAAYITKRRGTRTSIKSPEELWSGLHRARTFGCRALSIAELGATHGFVVSPWYDNLPSISGFISVRGSSFSPVTIGVGAWLQLVVPYVSCLVISIPRRYLAGPRSVMLNSSAMTFFTASMSSSFLPVIVTSLT